MNLFDNVLCAAHLALKLWFKDSKRQFEVSELQKSLKNSIRNFKFQFEELLCTFPFKPGF